MQIPRLTAVGRGVTDGLNANISFGTFANAIWDIVEKRSALTETEVGQNYAVRASLSSGQPVNTPL